MINRRVGIYTFIGTALIAMVAFKLISLRKSSAHKTAARSVIESYFKHLGDGDVDSLFACFEPLPAAEVAASVCKSLAHSDLAFQGDISSATIIDYRLEGDMFAALIGWQHDLGYQQVDLVYVTRNKLGEWKMPPWLPYPLRPMHSPMETEKSLWTSRMTSFDMVRLIEIEPEQDAAQALLEWANPERDRLNEEYFRRDVIKEAQKLTADRSPNKLERAPKDVVGEYFEALKAKRSSELLSLIARPQGSFQNLTIDDLKIFLSVRNFRGPTLSNRRVTNRSKQIDSVAVVICALQPTEESALDGEFPITLIEQQNEWRILENFDRYGIRLQKTTSDQTTRSLDLSAQERENIQELVSWAATQITERRKQTSAMKRAANEKARAVREEAIAELIQQGRAFAKQRVEAKDKELTPSEVMREYLDYCEKNEPVKVISLHHWSDANHEPARFRSLALSHPLLLIPQRQRTTPEIEFSKLRIVGEQIRGNFSAVLVERPPGTKNAPESVYFSTVFFAKQDGEWRVLVGQVDRQTILDSENLIEIHGLPLEDAVQFKELTIWGRKTGHDIRKTYKEQQEQLKVEESVATVAIALERIEERTSNSTVADTPLAAFEKFWSAYKAGDWATAVSFVTLELALAEGLDSRELLSEEFLRQGDLTNRVRKLFERTDKATKSATTRPVVRGVERACAVLDREVPDNMQKMIRPEVTVAWSNTSGEAAHLIFSVVRKYSNGASTEYFFPAGLMKISGEWRFITLPSSSRFGALPESCKNDRARSWKKTDDQMKAFDR